MYCIRKILRYLNLFNLLLIYCLISSVFRKELRNETAKITIKKIQKKKITEVFENEYNVIDQSKLVIQNGVIVKHKNDC